VKAYCIFIDALLEGPVPSVRDALGRPCLFESEVEAQREIADCIMVRLQEFLDGERDYEDAISIEEYIVQVDVLPNGGINDELGQRVD
jgi:hypothetical protein